MLQFSLSDPFKKVSPKIKSLYQQANALLSKLTKQDAIYDVSIVNNLQMQRLNKRYRKINKPTDVLSFTLPDNKANLIGEIFINYQQAKKQNQDFIYEMVYLFVHGVLHLLKYDHHLWNKNQTMYQAQNKIMRQLIWDNN